MHNVMSNIGSEARLLLLGESDSEILVRRNGIRLKFDETKLII